eukprot:s1837_g3.t1
MPQPRLSHFAALHCWARARMHQQQWDSTWGGSWGKPSYDGYSQDYGNQGYGSQGYGKGYGSYDDSYGGSTSEQEIYERCVPEYSPSNGGGYNTTSDVKGGKGRQAEASESVARKEIKGLVRSIIQAQAMPDGRGSEESTIFVAGLPSDMTNLEMYQLFSAFGAIAHRGATALQDKESGKCTGIGFVNFIESESAQQAIRALNSFPFLDCS